MVEYAKYIPQIAEHFNVTPDHVMEIFKATEVYSSMLWAQIIVIIFILSVLSSITIIWYVWNKGDKKEDAVIIFAIISIIFAVIYSIIGYMIGVCLINHANPEYAIYIQYATNTFRSMM